MSKPALVVSADDFEMLRAAAAPVQPAEFLRDATFAQLSALKAQVGLGSTPHIIEVPAQWMPPTARNLSRRVIDLRARLAGCAPASEEELTQWVTSLLRSLMALYMLRVSTGRTGLLKPSTFMLRATLLLRTAKAAMAEPGRLPGLLFAHLNVDQLKDIAPYNLKTVPIVLSEFRRRGILTDWPDVHTQDEFTKNLEKDPRKRRRKLVPRKNQEPFKPLPDEFVAEAGWRCAWLVRHFGDEVANQLEAALPTLHAAAKLNKLAGSTLRQDWFGRRQWSVVPDFDLWRPAGSKLAFPLQFKELLMAVSIMQGVNLFVTLLGIGARASEVLSFTTDALVYADNGTARVDGTTYKQAAGEEGDARDWPLPDIAAKALILQQRLAGLVRQLPGAVDSDAMWFAQSAEATNGGVGSGAVQLTTVMYHLPRALGVAHTLGEHPNLHIHRFRKTLARLVALALTDSPKLLMDLFGHRTVEMTLHYILTDPMLRAEIDEVARAQVVMFAKQVIEHAEENGGPAAPKILAAVREQRARLGTDAFGSDSVQDLAEVLTLNGKMFTLVRPGVICTKGLNQAGPCSKRLGHPEPSRCRSGCDCRLEDAAYLSDTDGALAEAVSNLEAAVAGDDDYAAELWRGQILAHLPRFPQLTEKWNKHPTVQTLIEQTKGTAL